ncbi:MAG TPA: hypothetical protein VNM22_08730 [Candidatus Limnocylindrales bacterium]|nr:hypothetical protein [Candidatus Limnocylindrales bacterium]
MGVGKCGRVGEYNPIFFTSTLSYFHTPILPSSHTSTSPHSHTFYDDARFSQVFVPNSDPADLNRIILTQLHPMGLIRRA